MKISGKDYKPLKDVAYNLKKGDIVHFACDYDNIYYRFSRIKDEVFLGEYIDSIECKASTNPESFRVIKSNWNHEIAVVNKSNNNIMSNLIEKARLLAKSEPEKSLTKKGITDINDILTADGEQLFKDFLYRANKAAFVADETIKALLAEEDKTNN